MELHLLKQKIVSLLNFRKTIRRELAIYDYAKSAFELKERGVSSIKYGDRCVVISLTTYSKRINRYI